MKFWTDAEDAKLIDLWDNQGKTASVIALHFQGASRGSIIGRVTRLRAAGKIKTGRASKPVQAIKQAAPAKASPPPPAPRPAPAPVVGPLPAAPRVKLDINIPLDVSRPVTLMRLRAGMCCWPLGDPRKPTFRYCGAPLDGVSPYCAGHRAMAYRQKEQAA